MLLIETVAVYCENHTEHTNSLCGQNAEFRYAKAGGTYSNHWVLKDQARQILQGLSSSDIIVIIVRLNIYEPNIHRPF
jgi:hypothetical protein